MRTKVSGRRPVWLPFVIVLVATPIVLLAQQYGDPYLRPAPMWLKLSMIACGAAVIGSLAVYSRRRVRRERS